MAAVNKVSALSPGGQWSKWQVAVVVGAPLAVAGVSYWYYRKSGKSRNRNMPGNQSKANPTSKTPSVEGPDPTTFESLEALIAKEKDPLQRAQLFKNEGNKYFKMAKYDDAIAMYTKAIEACPSAEKSDVFYQNRAAAYEQLRNYSKVIEDCTVALELNPRYTKALQRRAKALEQTEELEQCLEDVTAVCILEQFQNQSSIMQADRVLKALGRKHAKEAMKLRKPCLPSKYYLRTFLSSFYHDPIQRTIKEEFTPERLKSEDISSKKGFERAKHAFAIEDYEQVVAACTEEIDSVEADGGSTVAALLLRGTFYLWLTDVKSAQADFEAVIENEMADKKMRVNALIKSAVLKVQTEDRTSAFEDFEKAATLDPENSDIYHHRGQMYVLLEEHEEAKKDLEHAVKLSPNFPLAYAQKCYIDFRSSAASEAFETAKRSFEEAIQKFPDCTECYMLYAQVLTDKGNFKEADKYFEKAMNIDPTNATVRVQRGLLQLQWRNDVDKALQFIEEAIKTDSKCEFAYETLGTIEVQRGNLKRAVTLFEKAIPLSRTEFEMSHLYALHDAAVAQDKVATKLGFSTGL